MLALPRTGTARMPVSSRPSHRRAAFATLLLPALLSACGSGPVRRVSEPAARIQQLTVQANGQWSVELRLENFSSVPMRFDTVDLALGVGGTAAGRLRANPALGIGPESADTATVLLTPDTAAKLVAADALAARRALAYTLSGTVTATPDEGRARSYPIERSSELNPAPGLPGVLR